MAILWPVFAAFLESKFSARLPSKGENHANLSLLLHSRARPLVTGGAGMIYSKKHSLIFARNIYKK